MKNTIQRAGLVAHRYQINCLKPCICQFDLEKKKDTMVVRTDWFLKAPADSVTLPKFDQS